MSLVEAQLYFVPNYVAMTARVGQGWIQEKERERGRAASRQEKGKKK